MLFRYPVVQMPSCAGYLRRWRSGLVCLVVNHATSAQRVQKLAERVDFVVSRRRWKGFQ